VRLDRTGAFILGCAVGALALYGFTWFLVVTHG
jgi:hypothetical protein